MGVPASAHTAAVSAASAGGGHGVIGANDFAVSQNGTPNMSVNVAAGYAIVRSGGSQSVLVGAYALMNDATVNVSISASDPTNPRIDLVVLQVRDSNYGEAASDERLTVVTGTPAGSPVVPSLTSYPNCIVLAQVAVAAAVTTIVTANITDKRTFAYAIGGTARGPAATPPTGASLRSGLEFFETDTLKTKQYNGTSFLHMARRIICTSGTRPSGAQLFAGLEIYETDTNRVMLYTGAAWKIMHQPYTSFTPGWSGTIGNGQLTGAFCIASEWCFGWIVTAWGTTTSHAATSQQWNIPSGLVASTANSISAGGARCLDNGVANYVRTVNINTTGTMQLWSEAGAPVTNLVPFTWGNTDACYLQFFFPVG